MASKHPVFLSFHPAAGMQSGAPIPDCTGPTAAQAGAFFCVQT